MSTWEANEELEEQYHDGNWTIKDKVQPRTGYEGP
jgi:hypothetical protein